MRLNLVLVLLVLAGETMPYSNAVPLVVVSIICSRRIVLISDG